MEKILKKKKSGEYQFVLKPKYDKGELAKEVLRGLAVGGILVMSLAAPNLLVFSHVISILDKRHTM